MIPYMFRTWVNVVVFPGSPGCGFGSAAGGKGNGGKPPGGGVKPGGGGPVKLKPPGGPVKLKKFGQVTPSGTVKGGIVANGPPGNEILKEKGKEFAPVMSVRRAGRSCFCQFHHTLSKYEWWR